MAKFYTSPVFFIRLELLLFLITDEPNLMFCWAQFTFSEALVQKFTPGLGDFLPCFPSCEEQEIFLLTALLLIWEKKEKKKKGTIVSKNTPKTKLDHPQLEKAPTQTWANQWQSSVPMEFYDSCWNDVAPDPATLATRSTATTPVSAI